jgi:hypothetical protein
LAVAKHTEVVGQLTPSRTGLEIPVNEEADQAVPLLTVTQAFFPVTTTQVPLVAVAWQEMAGLVRVPVGDTVSAVHVVPPFVVPSTISDVPPLFKPAAQQLSALDTTTQEMEFIVPLVAPGRVSAVHIGVLVLAALDL